MFKAHLHIKGQVQGVGYRPYVCQLARQMGINGWVINGADGLHIMADADHEIQLEDFIDAITLKPPAHALITSVHRESYVGQTIPGFFIQKSTDGVKPDLLLSPDRAICSSCQKEFNTPGNSRFQYPFITCLECGPRYSIQTGPVYDRSNTTMQPLKQCKTCCHEVNATENLRFHSQTNSCPRCAIALHVFDNFQQELNIEQDQVMGFVAEQLAQGKILAIKGLGGYLLMCDASNAQAVALLRTRKHRPQKPLAVLFAHTESLKKEVEVHDFEERVLTSATAPIVLCQKKEGGLCADNVAPGLSKLGVMLPSTGLLLGIAQLAARPLIATSANLSGSPIVYQDKDAREFLGLLADFIITYDREIVAPQDDSVIQFTRSGQQIILRRSRGMAPNYYPHPFSESKEEVLALGADLKNTFGIFTGSKVFISQYLGNQESLEAQQSAEIALSQLKKLTGLQEKIVLSDLHPAYFTTQKAATLVHAKRWLKIQHHEAHFAAVLAENDLLQSQNLILGCIWDGTGYGTDGQVWGGEQFIFERGKIDRRYHLHYQPVIAADKMSKEPRLSALSFTGEIQEAIEVLKPKFTETEWKVFQKLRQDTPLKTSSMGRFIDAVAALLGVYQINTFEGEAAMKLEALADSCMPDVPAYEMEIEVMNIEPTPILAKIALDITAGILPGIIAKRFFQTLAEIPGLLAERERVRKIAFSGGVFQNSLLVNLIRKRWGNDFDLYFHVQTSPNDECISLGQLAWYALQKEIQNRQAKELAQKLEVCV